MPSKEAMAALCAIRGVKYDRMAKDEDYLAVMNQDAEVIDRQFAGLRRDLAEHAERADGWEREAEKLQDLRRIAGELLLALQATMGELQAIQTAAALSGLPPKAWAGFGAIASKALERARAAGIGVKSHGGTSRKDK